MVTQWVNEVVSFDNWVKNTTVYENLRVFRPKLPRKNVHPSKWAIIILYPSCENIPSSYLWLIKQPMAIPEIYSNGQCSKPATSFHKKLVGLVFAIGVPNYDHSECIYQCIGQNSILFSSTNGCVFSVFKDIRLLAMRSAISWICGKVSWKTWNWVWDVWDVYKKHISICIFWDLTSKFCVLMVYFMQ